MLSQLGHRLLDVDSIAWVDDRQVGHAAEDREVLRGLVAGSVPSRQPGQPSNNVDVESGLGGV
jgi:hypothetical protein